METNQIYGAQGETRTLMSETLDPKSSAYTNFATHAYHGVIDGT